MMIGAHHQEAGELAMRSGGGLQRHAREAADLGEPLLQLEHQREVALHGVEILQRMSLGEGREPRDLLIDLGIVFHGAGAERIEAAIDPEITLRQREIVPHHIELRELGEAVIFAQVGCWNLRLRHVGLRQIDATSAGDAELVERRSGVAAHRAASLSACTRRSMLARVLTSVTAISMWSRSWG